MQNTEFYTLCGKCRESILRQQLLEAIDALDEMAIMLGRASLIEEVRLLRQDYVMLLGIVKEEFLTVNRAAYFNDIILKAHALCDDLFRYFLLHNTDAPVAKVWHRLRMPADRLADIYVPLVEGQGGRGPSISAVLADPLASYHQQFDVVWSSARWSGDERRSLYDYLTDEERPALNRLTLVGAVGLGLLTFYDAEKFHLLLDVIDPEHVDITVRAALMIVFATSHYEARLHYDSSLSTRIDAFFSDERYQPLLRALQKSLAVVTASPKLSAELENGMSEALAQRQEVEEIATQETLEDVEQLIEDDPRLKKFHEGMMSLVQDFLTMHVRGVDINYNSFRVIPEMLPFFQEAANWFCPFSLDHPLLFNINPALRFLGIMSREKSCDTDRYAMVLVMDDRVPEIHIIKRDAETEEETTIEAEDVDSVVEHLAESMETITEQQRRSLTDIKSKVLYPIVVCAVQDSFRFFHLFPGLEWGENPFDDLHDLWAYDNPRASVLYSNPDDIRSLGDWYFEMDEFNDALELYRRLPDDARSVDTLRRLGFIYMQLDQPAKALDYYLSATTLEPNDEWTLLQLALVYLKLHRLDEAEAVNQQLITLFPDNHRYERNLGELYLRHGKYEAALPIFIKLDYLTPDRRSILRALAWSHLGLGHYDEASRIYDRLLSDATASSDDYINAGHCALLQGDCTTAVAYYQQSLKISEGSQSADDLFRADYLFLLKRGIDYATIQMLTDMIRM